MSCCNHALRSCTFLPSACRRLRFVPYFLRALSPLNNLEPYLLPPTIFTLDLGLDLDLTLEVDLRLLPHLQDILT